MTNSTPKIQDNLLHLTTTNHSFCQVDSTEWFAWLNTATRFRYFPTCRLRINNHYSRPMQPISVRKEQRRQGFLWYAYRRVNGKLNKRYVGKTDTLTSERLDEIATELNTIW